MTITPATATTQTGYCTSQAIRSPGSRGRYTVILGDTEESAELEASHLDRLSPAVDGFVLAASRLPDAELADLHGKPVVLFDREVSGLPSVVTDSAEGSRQIIEHLVALGHRSITYLLAIGALQRLLRRGVDVPGAVSVVGYDDIFGSDFCNPPPTTLTGPAEQAGPAGPALDRPGSPDPHLPLTRESGSPRPRVGV
ncbi:LacI family transcriptional regulator, partial [Pseudonocardia bannensis]